MKKFTLKCHTSQNELSKPYFVIDLQVARLQNIDVKINNPFYQNTSAYPIAPLYIHNRKTIKSIKIFR